MRMMAIMAAVATVRAVEPLAAVRARRMTGLAARLVGGRRAKARTRTA